VLLAETLRRNGDADANREAPFGRHNHIAGIAGPTRTRALRSDENQDRPADDAWQYGQSRMG
jgi:hypothetical protein